MLSGLTLQVIHCPDIALLDLERFGAELAYTVNRSVSGKVKYKTSHIARNMRHHDK